MIKVFSKISKEVNIFLKISSFPYCPNQTDKTVRKYSILISTPVGRETERVLVLSDQHLISPRIVGLRYRSTRN